MDSGAGNDGFAWKAMERMNEDDSEEEDVYENIEPVIQSIIADESVVNDKPWIIMADFNVALKPEEHSNRGSGINGDMHEFNDFFNGVEVEDICCLGFQFTWTKSLKNPENFILNKLDRIMINDCFNQKYGSAHGVFLPYLISDCSHILLVFPKGLPKKVKSFRFTNYIAYKEEFLILWLKNGIGVCMDVTYAQKEVNKDPSNMDKKKLAVKILEEYTEVASDELKLLHQKAKIDWLRDGDKNISYFHSMLKAKKHNNRVESTISLDQLGQIVNLKLSCEDVEAIIVEVVDVETK
ncbi:RNA-directed DNA polymerase, eukaryota, reverse transcriptase zinc-binding domain protein [Tanacetum coccineum]